MYVLLTGVFYYLVGGYSTWQVPFETPSVVIEYVLPLMFLGGAGLVLYGVFLKIRG